MNRRPWINKYGTVALALMILLVMSPELREFFWVTQFIGLDLMIFFIVVQLRDLLGSVPSLSQQMPRFLCVAGYAALRVTTRMIALLIAPAGRGGTGLTTLLFVLSTNMWCPTPKQGSTAF